MKKKEKNIIFFLIYHLLSLASFIHNETGGKKQGGGLRFLTGRTQEGGGGHSDAYCVQQGGWGGSKNREKMRM